MQRVVFKSPIDVDISDIKYPLERTAPKIYTERMANQAMRSVTANQIFGLDRVKVTTRRFHIGDDAVIILQKFD